MMKLWFGALKHTAGFTAEPGPTTGKPSAGVAVTSAAVPLLVIRTAAVPPPVTNDRTEVSAPSLVVTVSPYRVAAAGLVVGVTGTFRPGAGDYVTTPFSSGHIPARIAAVLRRTPAPDPPGVRRAHPPRRARRLDRSRPRHRAPGSGQFPTGGARIGFVLAS